MCQAGACQASIRGILAVCGLAFTTQCDATETRLDFSNTLSKSQIEEMATVDEFEVVKEVQVGSSVLCREEED
jgi:hypothetical protein